MTEVLYRQIVPAFVEVPRKPLEKALTSRQKKLMVQAFIPDADALLAQLEPRFPRRKEFVMF